MNKTLCNSGIFVNAQTCGMKLELLMDAGLTLIILNEQVREISNNVVCAASKATDQPAHTRSLIRTFASR